MPDLVIGPDGQQRCWWGAGPDYVPYHDLEWGRAATEDHVLFEKLCLEGFQSGLSWLTILRKRPAFRMAFAGFQPNRVAEFGEEEVKEAVQPCAGSKTWKPKKKHWIQIELLYEDDNSPVRKEEYCITLPDGSEVRGYTDGGGRAYVPLDKPGNCQITFPNLDKDAWKPRES